MDNDPQTTDEFLNSRNGIRVRADLCYGHKRWSVTVAVLGAIFSYAVRQDSARQANAWDRQGRRQRRLSDDDYCLAGHCRTRAMVTSGGQPSRPRG
jgi:hypothetical protein